MNALFALFIRTLREHGRARSTYLMRGFICALLLVFLLFAHLQSKWMGAPGKSFFTFVVFLNYVFVTLAGLGVCSAVIADEKEEGTLSLLRMTDLNSLALLLGKGGGRFTTFVLVLMVQVPFVMVAVTMGGVSAWQIVTAYTLLVSYLAAMAGVGLFFSTLLSKVWRAALMTFVFGVMWSILPWCLHNCAANLAKNSQSGATLSMRLEEAGEWLWSVHPANHASHLLQSSYLSLDVTRSVSFHLILGFTGVLLAWLVFERRCGDEAAYGESRGGGRPTRRFVLLRPARTWMSALAWKDFHFHFGGKTLLFLRFLLYPFAIAVLAWSSGSGFTRWGLENAAWTIGSFAFYVEITLLTLRAWAPERWGRNLPSLLATPLPMRRLHREKLYAGFLALTPSLAVVALAIGFDAFNTAHVFMVSERGLLAHVGTLANLLCFLGFCLNFSLRLKWTALPAALGGWVVTTILVQILSFVFLLPMLGLRSSSFGSWSFIIPELLRLPALFAIAGYLCFDANRQIIRHAADN